MNCERAVFGLMIRPHANTPTSRGTEVKVLLRYDPPGGALGAAIAKLFGEDPEHQVKEELRRFKQIVETGEIATAER